MPLENKITINDIATSVTSLDNNFIPKGTIFTVKLDGSGDFNTLSEALNYLIGKYSNGAITISLSAGTHEVSSMLYFDGAKYNIPYINIVGEGVNDTIIQGTTLNEWWPIIEVQHNSTVRINNLTLTHKNYNNNYLVAIKSAFGGHIDVCNVNFTNIGIALQVVGNSTIFLDDTINITDAIYACLCSGNLSTDYDTVININNVGTVWWAEYGGRIQLVRCALSYSKVTTRASDTLQGGNISTNKFVTGY